MAAAAALLAAVGSVVGLSPAATIYGQETASLADQATAQDLTNLLLVAPLVLVLGWRAHGGATRRTRRARNDPAQLERPE